MSCEHSSPRLISKFFCTTCQQFYGETEITVEVLARAFWMMKAEDHKERVGTALDQSDEFDDQSEELREWCRWRVGRLMEIAKEVAKEARNG